ncbi:hypothetical protein ACIRPK_29990 [Kitasatospora sp. NPDC101801]|uniref:hypothetical protein n=1 Tax=Kitasatospora sp. NPDC101801 TaxID=3364103 RepID=UPI0037F27E2B
MSTAHTSLGPLTRVDDRWLVGDHQRAGGMWLEFRAEGLCVHQTDSTELVTPWARIMDLNRFTLGAKYPRGSYGALAVLGGWPGPWNGRGRGHLHLTLRHPYEDWLASFDRHPRPYSFVEVTLFDALLRRTAEDGGIHRLGDREWLGRAVQLLAEQRPMSAGRIRDAVTEALRA